ncbi:MAG: pilin [Woeseiaceae bacterium]
MRRFVVVFSVFAFSLAACSKDEQKAKINQSDDILFAPAWLSERVTDDAFMYGRQPSLFGLTSAPKDNALAPMLASEAHVEWLNSVITGLAENVAPQPGLESPGIQWLLRHQRSPIEWLVSPIPGAPKSAPSVTVTMTTDFESTDAMAEALNELLGEFIPGALLAALNDQGYGAIEGLPAPAFVSFNEKTSRIIVLAGAAVTEKRMVEALDALKETVDISPMAPIESRIDDSGYGFFYWVNTAKALTMAQMFVPPEYMQPVIESGLDKARSFGFGYGVSRGKTRLGFFTDIPAGDGMRSLIPVPANSMQVKTTAAPKLLGVFSLPTFSEIKAIAFATGQVSEADWQENMEIGADYLGLSLESLYDIFAGEVLYIREPVGTYGALKIGKGVDVDDIVEKIATKFELPFENRAIRGLNIRYLKLPGGPSEQMEEAGASAINEGIARTMMEIYLRVGTHLFWTYEGDYLLLADSPQVLIDRKARGASVSLDDWANDTAMQDLEHTALGVAASVDGLPRFAHQAYIATAPAIADIADVELDVWSFPTADDLNLPERGVFAFNLVTDTDMLGVELAFEHSPLDALGGSGGGLVAIAGIGIVAAVAIPAYQDYTIRAQVSEGLIAAATAQSSVQEFVATNGRFPNEAEAESLAYRFDGAYASSVFIEPDTGVVEVQFDGPAANMAISYSTIRLSPDDIDSGLFSWNCETDLNERYLPSACRPDWLAFPGSP